MPASEDRERPNSEAFLSQLALLTEACKHHHHKNGIKHANDTMHDSHSTGNQL